MSLWSMEPPEWLVKLIQRELDRQQEAAWEREVQRQVDQRRRATWMLGLLGCALVGAVLAAALSVHAQMPLAVRVPLAVSTALGAAASLVGLLGWLRR
jgi:hypothetical protein